DAVHEIFPDPTSFGKQVGGGCGGFGVCEFDGFVVGVDHQNGQDGTQDLFLHDRRVGVHVSKNSWGQQRCFNVVFAAVDQAGGRRIDGTFHGGLNEVHEALGVL